jgi:hypothetical protein
LYSYEFLRVGEWNTISRELSVLMSVVSLNSFHTVSA